MKAKQVMKILNITRPTLCKYVKEKTINATLLPNGQYNYDDESVFNYINKNKPRDNVIYARVSSSNQKKDLENQIETLSKFCSNNSVIVNSIYKDIKSGIHFDRKGFDKLLENVMLFKIDKVFITYKDRFARLSYSLMEKIFNSYGTKIIPISEIDNEKTTEQEFFEDLSTLIHSFSMKMYSKRRKEKLQLIEKDLELEKEIQ
jgi:predicted site-specific integrase-resolvase